MALKKKIQSINGVTSNYHRIISVNFDMLNNKADFHSKFITMKICFNRYFLYNLILIFYS